MSHSEQVDRILWRRFSWTALLALLVSLLFFSPFFERQENRRLPGESTLLMAAESLAWDGDFSYRRTDFDRHVLTWLEEPPDLALVTGDGGRHWAYDVPPAAALWLAPFVRWWPQQGFALANCLALFLVGLAVAVHWQSCRGVWGPLILALCLAASLVIGAPFLADGGLLQFVSVLLAFTCLARPLVNRDAAAAGARRRWDLAAWGAGGLLAVPVTATAIHGWLAVAALWMVPRRRRLSLVLGFFGVLALSWWIQAWAGGGGPLERREFGPSSGFPQVDFAGPADLNRAGWEPRLLAEPTHGGQEAGMGLDLATRRWALVDRLFGERLGIVPFFPLVLPLLWGIWRVRRRRPLLWGCLAWLLTLAMVSPRDLEMGGALWAGGLWLPVYGALVASLGWEASRDGAAMDRNHRQLLPWMVALMLAVWTLPEVWRDPLRAPTRLAGTADAGGVASRGAAGQSMGGPRFGASFWPLETTQERFLSGDRLGVGDQAWVQLDGATWVEAENERLVLPADRPSDWILASPQKLDGDGLENLLSDWEVLGLARSYGPSDVLTRQGLGIRVTVESRWPRRHAVGWTRQPQWLYRLRLHPVVESERVDLAFLALQAPEE